MAYTNSSLATYKNISKNKTSPRNHVIDTITIHCLVAQWTAKRGCDYFATTDKDCSANYVVGYDGSIGLSVEEKDRSWCSSSGANDHRAITIEVASDMQHPYAVTDKALAALIELVADICKRNNIKQLRWKDDKSLIGQVDKQNMTLHRWLANTSCPGDYLYSKHPYIVQQVNKKLGVVDAEIPVNKELKFKVGDIVKFAGGTHYSSGNATSGKSVNGSNAKVTAVSKDAKHPYHLRAVNDGGAFISGVYGWVDECTVSEIKPVITGKIDTIKEVQIWANTNYKAGLEVDGSCGPKTKKALIKILQTELNQTYNAGLEVDGSFGPKTTAACPNLRQGMKNDVVGVLQALLICKGYSEAYLDKSYGSITTNAVKSFQKKKGLTVDGSAGKYTFAELCK